MIFLSWISFAEQRNARRPIPRTLLLRKGCAWASLSVVALELWLVACGPAPDALQPRKAPTFTLPSMQGEQIALESARGKIVVLDFWATWCHPCVEQIPILNRFYERNRGAGVMVYGISLDADGVEAVEPFMEKHEIRYPVLLGRIEVAEAYGIRSFPGSVVIDAEGNVRSMHIGVADERMLEKLVARARIPLKKPVASPAKAKD